jgi:DNA-binding MarR family transcriptional regulator
MVDRGYVERKDDAEDKRIRRLLLTARGRAALREARRFHARVERELADALGVKQVANARAVLMALAGESARGDTRWAGNARPF